MKKVTLRNSFHNTSRTILVPAKGTRVLSPRAVRDIKRALCGIPGCVCGDGLGMRDDDAYSPTQNPNLGFRQITDPWGSVEIWLE